MTDLPAWPDVPGQLALADLPQPAPAPEPEPEPATFTHTEASLLELLRQRCSVRSQGTGTRYLFATHVRAGAGFDQRTADAVTMDTWASGSAAYPHPLDGYEVKTSRSDWLRELKDPEKCEAVRRYCRRWWLVTVPGVVKGGELPPGWGLLVVRGRSLRVDVQAPLLRPEEPPRGWWVAFTRAAVKTEARRGGTS